MIADGRATRVDPRHSHSTDERIDSVQRRQQGSHSKPNRDLKSSLQVLLGGIEEASSFLTMALVLFIARLRARFDVVSSLTW